MFNRIAIFLNIGYSASMPIKVDEVALLEDVIALRAAELDGASEQVAAVRSSLEALIGPTVSRAVAARVLGVSFTALDRHIDSSAVASVITPTGRREVPLEELLTLAVEQRRLPDGYHPLALILKERRSRAAALSASRLLPRTITASGHRRAALQGLAYHRAVADQLSRQDVRDARRRLARWRAEGLIDERWGDRWASLLERPISDIRRTISADDDAAADLRQSSPFAGTLSELERRRVLEIVRGAA